MTPRSALSPLTTRHRVTYVRPPPGPTVPCVLRKPLPTAGAGSGPGSLASTVASPRRARGRPRPRHARLRGALGRKDMARELRALLLWGRRLRAPVLPAAPGGEGDWTGGRVRVCIVLPRPRACFVLCGRHRNGTPRAEWETVRFVCQMRSERRTSSARCVLVTAGLGPALPGVPRR